MNKRMYLICLCLFLLTTVAAAFLDLSSLARNQVHSLQSAAKSVDRESPPAAPLPDVLDPAKFADNRAAFVTYTIAGGIKEILHHVPCQCGCDREQGHQSLLDCFTSEHGSVCGICQQEAIFCYLSHNKGVDPAQIREAILKGKARKIDVAKFASRFP